MYLLDTCTISYLFAHKGGVEKRVRATPPSEIALSSITIMEVLYGFAIDKESRQRRAASLDALCSVIQIIDFDQAAAGTAAQIRAELKTKGIPIGPWDLLIGATAKQLDCVLVTSNLREFSRIDGLKLEDWR